MGVEREYFYDPFAVGSCVVPRVERATNGQWSVEFLLNFRVKLPDGREVLVNDRHVMVRATEQRGRKRRTDMETSEPRTYYDPATSERKEY